MSFDIPVYRVTIVSADLLGELNVDKKTTISVSIVLNSNTYTTKPVANNANSLSMSDLRRSLFYVLSLAFNQTFLIQAEPSDTLLFYVVKSEDTNNTYYGFTSLNLSLLSGPEEPLDINIPIRTMTNVFTKAQIHVQIATSVSAYPVQAASRYGDDLYRPVLASQDCKPCPFYPCEDSTVLPPSSPYCLPYVMTSVPRGGYMSLPYQRTFRSVPYMPYSPLTSNGYPVMTTDPNQPAFHPYALSSGVPPYPPNPHPPVSTSSGFQETAVNEHSHKHRSPLIQHTKYKAYKKKSSRKSKVTKSSSPTESSSTTLVSSASDTPPPGLPVAPPPSTATARVPPPLLSSMVLQSDKSIGYIPVMSSLGTPMLYAPPYIRPPSSLSGSNTIQFKESEKKLYDPSLQASNSAILSDCSCE